MNNIKREYIQEFINVLRNTYEYEGEISSLFQEKLHKKLSDGYKIDVLSSLATANQKLILEIINKYDKFGDARVIPYVTLTLTCKLCDRTKA